MISLVTFPYLNTVSDIDGKASWSRTLDGFSQAKVTLSNCDDICEYLSCWKSGLRFTESFDGGIGYVWSGVVTQIVSSESTVEITASDFSVLISRLGKTITGTFTPLQAWEKLAKLVYDQFHVQLDVQGFDSPYLMSFNNLSASSVLDEISKVTDWTVVDTTVFVGNENKGDFDISVFTGGYSTQCKAADIYTRVTVSNGAITVTKANMVLEQELGFEIPKTIDSTLATRTSLENYASKWLAQAGTALKLVTGGDVDVCTVGVQNIIPGQLYSVLYRSFCEMNKNMFRINTLNWNDNVISIEFDQTDQNEDDGNAF